MGMTATGILIFGVNKPALSVLIKKLVKNKYPKKDNNFVDFNSYLN